MLTFRSQGHNKYLREQRKDVVSFYYFPKGAVKDSEIVFIWDLDKTYLETQFESLRGLIRTVFEKSAQKVNVPGTATLVRAMAKKIDPLPIYFITASPPQMQEKIRLKLKIDGIQPYGFFSKDNLKNLRPSLWSRLTNHIGFKIQALMEIRLMLSEKCKMLCWGDDSEADATVYTLFSDICAHRLTDRETFQMLQAFKVPEDQIKLILELRDQRENFDPLDRVYINLAVDTDPEYYRRYGRRLMAVENCFEIAVDLFQRGYVDLEGVLEVVKDLMSNYTFKAFKIERSYQVLSKRKRLSDKADEILRPALISIGALNENFEPETELVTTENLPLIQDFDSIVRPWIPERVNYLSDY